MKKFLVLLLLILLCGCNAEREDYYVLSFDDYTICVGYDDAEFVKLVYDVELPDVLSPEQTVGDLELDFWGKEFGTVSFTNPKNKEIASGEAILSKAVFYLEQTGSHVLKIDDVELSNSVKENCSILQGEYIEKNGTACVIGKKVKDKDNVLILYGDIFSIDQDELSRIEISVE